MSFLKEFKEFAMRGNVIDMALGVVIGAAFGKITASLVSDVIMPVLGMFTGFMDFTNRFICLGDVCYPTLKAAKDAGAPVIAYGQFINVILDFIFIAFAVFILVKGINHLHKKEAEAPKPVCKYCKEVISVDAVKCPHCGSSLTYADSSEALDWVGIEHFMSEVKQYVVTLPHQHQYVIYPLVISLFDDFLSSFKSAHETGVQVHVRSVDDSLPDDEQVVAYIIVEEPVGDNRVFRIFCSSHVECMSDLQASFDEILKLT